MKNSVRILRVSNIDIFLHWTFLVMMAGLFGFYLYKGASLLAAFAGLALVSTVFGCVVLHELGHALTAKKFGIQTQDITMYPIGGVARLLRMPREPMHEFWIAIAGPAVNLFIAGVLYVLLVATSSPTDFVTVYNQPTNVFGLLMYINLSLVGFNMLPAFPMDGGRVLRAGLATKMDYKRATRIAGFVGQLMAFVFLLVGIFQFNPVLIFIALFVFMAAQHEVRAVTQS